MLLNKYIVFVCILSMISHYRLLHIDDYDDAAKFMQKRRQNVPPALYNEHRLQEKPIPGIEPAPFPNEHVLANEPPPPAIEQVVEPELENEPPIAPIEEVMIEARHLNDNGADEIKQEDDLFELNADDNDAFNDMITVNNNWADEQEHDSFHSIENNGTSETEVNNFNANHDNVELGVTDIEAGGDKSDDEIVFHIPDNQDFPKPKRSNERDYIKRENDPISGNVPFNTTVSNFFLFD